MILYLGTASRPQAVKNSAPKESDSMLSSFLLSLREGVEAALVIGIALSMLQRSGRPELKLYIWSGLAAGVLTSAAAALAINLLGAEFEGQAEILFEGLSMLAAAALLTWMIFWMQRHSAGAARQVEEEVHQAVHSSNRWALFFLAFMAVLREGLELSLFLFAVRFTATPLQTLEGALLGLLTAALLGWLLFTSTLRLNLRRFFQITNLLLLFFAAGLVAQGVRELNEAAWVPAVVEHVWDINHLLDVNSVPGQLLSAMFGYNSRPSLTETLAWTGYLVLIFSVLRFMTPKRPLQTTGRSDQPSSTASAQHTPL